MKTTGKTLVLAAAIFAALTLTLGWSINTVFSALLTSLALVLVRGGIGSPSRLQSLLTVAWLYWGLSYVSNLIEAVYFQVLPAAVALRGALFGLIMALAIAALLEWMSPPPTAPQQRLCVLATGLFWRIPVLVFAFFVIYIAAGAAVFPWVASYYAHMHLPTLPQLLKLQLGRGLLDLVCLYPVFGQWEKSRRRALAVSACVFTVLCGWAPLLLPNQFMPGNIRLAHAAEMGASGIAFGLLAALLLLQNAPPTPRNTP